MRRFSLVSRLIGLTAAFWVSTAGCSGPSIGHDLSGQITLDGNQVSDGQIYFAADKEKGNDGPSANVPIKDGRYTTAFTGQNVPVGPVRVRIEMVVDGVMHRFATTTELPPSPGTKDFAVTSNQTEKFKGLTPPGSPGGGKGKARPKDADTTEKKDDKDK
jgi:hypothetical protein